MSGNSIDLGEIIKQLGKLEVGIIKLEIAITKLHRATIILNTDFVRNANQTQEFNRLLKTLTLIIAGLTGILVILSLSEAIPYLQRLYVQVLPYLKTLIKCPFLGLTCCNGIVTFG